MAFLTATGFSGAMIWRQDIAGCLGYLIVAVGASFLLGYAMLGFLIFEREL